MNLTEFSKQIHQANKEKGFYDDPKEIGTILMLIVSELGEAMEAYRKKDLDVNNDLIKKIYKEILEHKDYAFDEFGLFIKDTFEDEIADTIIRLLDLCGYLNIDIESHIKAKLEYNKTRPYKHGKDF